MTGNWKITGSNYQEANRKGMGLSSTEVVTVNIPTTPPESRAFYPALDGFRAIAFLMVFFHHYNQLPWGWAGVDLFFVLSGFLITGILFDSWNGHHRYRNFYLRRALRIFPLYYGVMLLLVVTYPLLHWQMTWGWVAWLAYVGNFARFLHPYVDGSPFQRLADFQPIGELHGFHVPLALGHFWSLCLEEQFYLVWPCVVFTVGGRTKLAWICALSLPICLGMRLTGQHVLPDWMLVNDVLNRATPVRMDALLIGGLVALLLRGPHANQLLRFGRFALPVALVTWFVVILLIPHGHILEVPYPYPNWTFTFGLSGLDISGALIILSAIQPTTVLYRFFNAAPLRWLGRISYGAYVLHDIPHPIFAWVGTRIAPTYARDISGAIALVFTIVAAWLSYRFYESRFLNLKERWTVR